MCIIMIYSLSIIIQRFMHIFIFSYFHIFIFSYFHIFKMSDTNFLKNVRFESVKICIHASERMGSLK